VDRDALSAALRTFCAALARLHEFNVARAVYQSMRHGCAVSVESSDRTRALCAQHNHVVDVSELLRVRLRLRRLRKQEAARRDGGGGAEAEAEAEAEAAAAASAAVAARLDAHFRNILGGRFKRLDNGTTFFDCTAAAATNVAAHDVAAASGSAPPSLHSPRSASGATLNAGESESACQPLFLSLSLALCRTRATAVGESLEVVARHAVVDSIARPLGAMLSASDGGDGGGDGGDGGSGGGRGVERAQRTELRLQLLSLPVIEETFSYLERGTDLHDQDSKSSAADGASARAASWSVDRATLLRHLSTASITVEQMALVDECRRGMCSLVSDDVLFSLGRLVDSRPGSGAAGRADADENRGAHVDRRKDEDADETRASPLQLGDAHLVRRSMEDLAAAASPSVSSRTIPVKIVPTRSARIVGASASAGDGWRGTGASASAGGAARRGAIATAGRKREQAALLALGILCDEILAAFRAVQTGNTFVLRVYDERGGAAGGEGAAERCVVGGGGGGGAAWAPTWALIHVHPSTERVARRAPPGAGADDGGVGHAWWSTPRLAAHVTIHLHHAPGAAERVHHERVMDEIHRAVDKVSFLLCTVTFSRILLTV
jgi:hypothetical protein